jgi:hypothetical protein
MLARPHCLLFSCSDLFPAGCEHVIKKISVDKS